MERAGFQSFIGWESHHVDHWKGLIFEEEDTPIALPGHETDGLTELVCDRLEGLKDRKEPFCLFAAYQSPHHPCSPPEQYAALYRDKVYADRDYVQESPPFRNHYNNGELGRELSPEEYREVYFGEITHMDAAFGRILSKLTELGLDHNTIVIFTSDHGDMAGRHGLYEKSVMFEEAVRVPLVVRVPDGPANAVCDSLFSSVDFLPTMLELCGLPPYRGAEGISYARAIRGETQAVNRDVVYMSHYESGQPGHCIRSGPFKLTADLLVTHALSLYDLDADPYEMYNLLEQPGHEKIAHPLLERIRQWHHDTALRAGDPDEAAEMSPWFKERMTEN